METLRRILIIALVFARVYICDAEAQKLLNVSYDPTRELYEEIDKLFVQHWKKEKGADVAITQSHGGSGKQARSVIDGLEADVVTLALAYDIDQVAAAGLTDPNWQARLPRNSAPYTSTIVFLVRKGNPKGIKDWDDLVKPGMQVITPNPKTSGGARWNYLAAWGYAHRKFQDEAKTKEFISTLLSNVPVLDNGARGATTTFVQRGIGDVLISWENEARLAMETVAKGQVEIIVPSLSILAEPPVAVVDANAKKHGTIELAEAYLKFLYTPEAQRILAKHHFRPVEPDISTEVAGRFPSIELLTIEKDFGGWKSAQSKHFDEGGTFDELYGVK